MKTVSTLWWIAGVATLMMFGGCASEPAPREEASREVPSLGIGEHERAAEEARDPVVRHLPSKRPAQTTAPRPPVFQPPERPEPEEPGRERAMTMPGQVRIMVYSEPAGGTVVVDGHPVGSAPLEVSVPVTERGFLSRQVSVKVRFVAADENGTSRTSELVLTPLDRAPVRLDFTPLDSRRTLPAVDG